jgi:hypothetical protein
MMALVHFEIAHEFDISLDALERAFTSPRLVDKLDAAIQELGVGVEKITEHRAILASGVLDRIRHYQARGNLAAFASAYLTREMCAWDVESVYTMASHAGRWTIVTNLKPEWREHFASSGTYAIEALDGGRSRRIVVGDIDVRLPVVKGMAERFVLAAVRKAFDEEAATLREVATLV